ncbi:MAG: hypothetical protein J6K32_12335 [Clostridia bacterium]|nr:hypothetical protein [Clostridia bacterium]
MLLLSSLLGLVCAAALGGLFYGTMVYQLTPGAGGEMPAAGMLAPPPLDSAVDAASVFPGLQLQFAGGTVTGRQAEDVRVDGVLCRAVTTQWLTADGQSVRTVCAAPQAYIAVLAQQGYMPQLITGYQLAGMDAVYETRGAEGLLAAQSGGAVYLLIGPADEQRMYALGAACTLAEAGG